MSLDFDENFEPEDRGPDPQEDEARGELEEFFDSTREGVFFSRQLEVRYEDRWYHWITNRALRGLVKDGVVRNEVRPLATGGTVNLMWHRGYRYYRRDAKRVAELVEEYADPNIGGAVGLHGEFMVLEGFARRQFVLRGRNTRKYEARSWTNTAHDLDFVFERDGIAYGTEVKNTLGYMEYEELQVKLAMCKELGLKAIFAARMLPKSWIKEIIDAGGFALIMKYQLYPIAHRELARRVSKEFGLPVDAPKALEDGTIDRFVRWHERSL